MRIGMTADCSIFLFVFGGVGLGLLIFAWRTPKEKDKTDPRYTDSPWLLNDDWQTPAIRSGSKASMYGVWAFAAVWNLLSAPLPFVMYDEVINKENHIALVGLLFTAVGIWLTVWAVRQTLEWKRFGATPVKLDPFPGSIGGHVGGTIEVGLPFDAANEFQLTLTNIHSYTSGSGDDRSYEIPVYATATQSRHLSKLAVEKAREKQSTHADKAILDVVQVRRDASGQHMIYPTGRHVGSSLGGFIVGAVFAAVGWYLIAAEGHAIFGAVFGGIGALIAIGALYMMLNSLEVSRDSNGIRTVRRILGIAVKRNYMRHDAFVKFTRDSSFQSQGTGKHVIYYSIHAVDVDGNKIVVGEDFKGESEATAAIRLIGRELGLTAGDRRDGTREPRRSWDPAGLLSRTQS